MFAIAGLRIAFISDAVAAVCAVKQFGAWGTWRKVVAMMRLLVSVVLLCATGSGSGVVVVQGLPSRPDLFSITAISAARHSSPY